jgi:hypothetical protein
VTQRRDLYVLRVRGLAPADQAENLAENKECQRAHHHETYPASEASPLVRTLFLKLHP